MGAGHLLFAATILLTGVLGHGSHESDNSKSDDWATMHMSEEHHIDNFDPTAFFQMHDFNSDGIWTANEIRRLYGLDDESLKDTTETVKDNAVNEVLGLFDDTGAGQITRESWLKLIKKGVRLPNFGLGPGHHGDDEYEYEIHHFEKFHDENTKEEDLTHPEDIEHFRKHDMLEDEAERIEKEQQKQIVEGNIPLKFRKQQ